MSTESNRPSDAAMAFARSLSEHVVIAARVRRALPWLYWVPFAALLLSWSKLPALWAWGMGITWLVLGFPLITLLQEPVIAVALKRWVGWTRRKHAVSEEDMSALRGAVLRRAYPDMLTEKGRDASLHDPYANLIFSRGSQGAKALLYALGTPARSIMP